MFMNRLQQQMERKMGHVASFLAAFGAAVCVTSAFADSEVFEYRTEVPLVADGFGEQAELSASASLVRIIEEALPQEIEIAKIENAKKVITHKHKTMMLTERDVDALNTVQMRGLVNTYDKILSGSSVEDKNRRFIAAADSLIVDGPVLSRLDPSKTYSFSDRGNLNEIDPKKYFVPEKRMRIQGEGWVVQVGKSDASTASKADVMYAKNTAFSAKNILQEEISRTQSLVSKAASNVPTFAIDSALSQTVIPGNVGQASLKSTTGAKRATISGRVIAPVGTDFRNMKLRIGGTDIDISPDAEGFFQFSEMPLGARVEVIVWDEKERLNRRIVPVTVTSEQRDVEIVLENVAVVQDLARSFDSVQSVMQSGFCATLSAEFPIDLKGAKIFVRGGTETYSVKFFDQNGLPKREQTALDLSGKFCVFNVRHDLVDVDVALGNGRRRSFVIHTKPTTFENDIVLDVDRTMYKQVSQTELLNFDETVDSARRDSAFIFGSPGVRSWFDGQKSSTWARVSHAAVSSERLYAAIVLEKDAMEPQYFPVSQEFLEVRWGTGAESLNGFALVSRSRLEADESVFANRRVVVDKKNPIVLRMLDASVLDEMERSTGTSFSRENGTAFVSVDLGSLGLDYADVRFAIRDTWTGQAIGQYSYVPSLSGSNPRLVRFFVGNLPVGQHSFVISDKSGVIHWLDVVRSRPGALQVLSIGE